jgi:hypothetical protein
LSFVSWQRHNNYSLLDFKKDIIFCNAGLRPRPGMKRVW